MTKLDQIEEALASYQCSPHIHEKACKQALTALSELRQELEKLLEALNYITTTPIGGKTEDYLCSSRLQQAARAALGGSNG